MSMTTVSHRLAPVVAMAGMLVIVGTGVAAGDSWHAADARGDVRGHSYDPEPQPCGTSTDVDASADTTTDITHLVVRHERYAVEVVVRFRDLTASGTHETSIAIKTPSRTYSVDVSRFQTGGSTRLFLARYQPPPPPDPDNECGMVSILQVGLPCAHFEGRIAPEHDLVSVRLPRRCLGYPKWVSGGASAYRWVGGAVHTDTWAPAGTDETGFIGPFGPEVLRD